MHALFAPGASRTAPGQENNRNHTTGPAIVASVNYVSLANAVFGALFCAVKCFYGSSKREEDRARGACLRARVQSLSSHLNKSQDASVLFQTALFTTVSQDKTTL